MVPGPGRWSRVLLLPNQSDIYQRFDDIDDFSRMSMLSTEKSPIMYPIKPIFDHNIKIETPEVMYKSKNFHQEFKTASDVSYSDDKFWPH